MQNRRQGFTLVEMSIVLVIIAVLVAGIMLSRSLIKTARLQTLVSDIDSYTSATNNFKQQYQALPGDFAGASGVWSAAASGNGDGEIGAVSGKEFETFGYWQQLYLAGMFSQSLTGVSTGAGPYSASINSNVPSGEVSGAGVTVAWWGTVAAGDSYRFPGYYGNVFMFGAVTPGCTNPGVLASCTYGAVISADQAQSLDAKVDDGNPSSGAVRAFNSTTYSCTTSSGNYNIANTTPTCALAFVKGF